MTFSSKPGLWPCPKSARVTRLIGQTAFLPDKSKKLISGSGIFGRLAGMDNKSLIKKHAAPIAHQTIGSILAVLILGIGAAVISYLTTHSALIQGVPAYKAISLGVGLFLAIAIGFFLLALAWYFIRTKPHVISEVKKRTEYQEALQRSALSRGDETIFKLGVDAEELKEQIKELKKFTWLHEIADTQARAINKYVIVERVLLCDLRLRDPIEIPYVEFWLDIINTSVYNITVHTDTIKGCIKFALNELLEGKKIIYLGEGIPPASRVNVNIKQRLNTTEVNLLAPYEKNKEDALPLFNLDDLVIMVSGGAQFPQVKPQPLKLPNSISSNEDEVSNLTLEIDSLKSQLDKLTVYKLIFEVDVPRSKANVFLDSAGYIVSLKLQIRFINSDEQPLYMNRLAIALIRKDESGTESEIPKIEQTLYEMRYEEDQWNFHGWDNIDLKISGRDKTPCHSIKGNIIIPHDSRWLLDSNCFLRVCMEAMNQPPYILNFDVDWSGMNLGWVNITPRM